MSKRAQIYDHRRCELGEGPLWHPERRQLFWFDILGNRMLSRADDEPLEWQFEEHHSAAGWIDRDTLLIASETGLWRFGIENGRRDRICPLEADNPDTRSNDGRADPHGGFWIGTMGKKAEKGLGAIYRYFEGELRRLHAGLSIPNSICFAADGRTGYFADTAEGQILKQALDRQGWPVGAPALFCDTGAHEFNPDGSVIDAEGALWNAQWGAGRVARYLDDGTPDLVVEVGGTQSSCPAFGGPDFRTLFVTTASEGMPQPDVWQGCVYEVRSAGQGRPEPQVRV